MCGGEGVLPGWKDCHTKKTEPEPQPLPTPEELCAKIIAAGGQCDLGIELRATLMWDGCNDLDLHTY